MKNLMIMILAGAVLALSCPSYAWVARGGGGYHASYSGGTAHASYSGYHAGYSCGGVTTGTTAAHGYNGYAAGTHVTATTQPVYVAPVYGGTYSYTTTPPPPVPQVTVPSPGTIVYSLPPGAQMQVINAIRYYVAGGVYYQAFFGNNGVYYVVQAAPM